jgi:hypothetical protein
MYGWGHTGIKTWPYGPEILCLLLFGFGSNNFIGDLCNHIRVAVTKDINASNVGHLGLESVRLLVGNDMCA